MPTEEVAVAVAEMITVLVTVAPEAGAMSEVTRFVLAIVSVTGIVCGELEAFGSAIVADAL